MPGFGAGPTDHHDVVEYDEGILDEDAVGLVRCRRNIDDLPSPVAVHRDVVPPLRQGEVRIGFDPVEVRQLAVGKQRGGNADEEFRHPFRMPESRRDS